MNPRIRHLTTRNKRSNPNKVQAPVQALLCHARANARSLGLRCPHQRERPRHKSCLRVEYPPLTATGVHPSKEPTAAVASNGFRYCLTLFPKSFAHVDRSTCALSVPRQYSDLPRIHVAHRATHTNSPTRRYNQHAGVHVTLASTGCHRPVALLSSRLGA